MKILHLTTWYSPRIGGVETHVRRVSEELRGLGCEVEIYTFTPQNNGGAVSFPRLKLPMLPYGFGILPMPEVFLRALRSDADIFHAHAYGCPMAWVGLVAGRLGGKPLVFTPHSDPYSRVFSLRDLGRAVPLEHSSRLIALTEYEARHLGRIVSDRSKIRIIPNGVDKPQTGERPIPEPYILCIGRVEFRHKGQDLLLDAYRMMLTNRKLVFIGEGPDEPRLRMLARRVPNVDVLGRVDEPSKGAWLAHADLVVVPSRMEPFGIVGLEALALGKRLVVTRVGALQHIVEPYGVLADPTPSSLSQAMQVALQQDPPVIDSGLLERYSWSRVAAETLGVYKELV